MTQPPSLLVKNFIGGANSGSTWGWLLLEGGKTPEMIFGVGQLPTTWNIPFFDQLPQYERVTSAETFFPISLPTHTTILAFFLPLGCILASKRFTSFYFQTRKQTYSASTLIAP